MGIWYGSLDRFSFILSPSFPLIELPPGRTNGWLTDTTNAAPHVIINAVWCSVLYTVIILSIFVQTD